MSARYRLLAYVILLGFFLPLASARERLNNPGFESGTTGWQLSGPVIGSEFPHSGSRYLVMGEINNGTDVAYQDVSIPPNATAATFTFWYDIYSDDLSGVSNDVLTVTIRNTNGSVLESIPSKSNADRNHPNYQKLPQFNLIAYKGRTIRIHFLTTLNGSVFTSFKIDDVSVEVTVPPTTLTLEPTLVTGATARMNGSVNPNGLSTSAYFEFGSSTSYGNATTPLLYGAGIDTVQGFQADLSGLSPGAIYHYRAVATSTDGTTWGADKIILTPSLTPSPDLLSVSGLPATTTAGQPFTVTIAAENDAGTGGQFSAINASILYSDGTDDLTITDVTAPWGENASPYNFAPGASIRDKTCTSMTAVDHLVEGQDNNWTNGEQHSMSFVVTPNKIGTLYVRARVTLRDGSGCSYNNDSSGEGGANSFDQQGWTVRQYSVSVTASGTAPVARFTVGDWRPVTGKSVTFDASGSTGTGLSYSWTTTDGQTSPSRRAQFTFNSPGTNLIKLRITDSIGRSDTTSATIIIQAANNGMPEPGQPIGADPVVLSTGNYIQEKVDLRLPGKGFPFEFKRFYNSKFSDQSGCPIGFGWTHSYNQRIQDTGTNVLVVQVDGGTWTFFPTNGGYVAEAGVFDLLVREDETWLLTDKGQTVRRFSTNGHLVSITDKNANTLTLVHEAGILRKIQDTAGRTVLFNTNDIGCISEIIDPIGRTIRFEYEQTNLVRVIDAKGQTNSYTYTASHQLEDARDAKGVLYLHNEYDPLNTVVVRQHDTFTNWTYFAYDFANRVTYQTNALGKVSKYSFDENLLVTNIVDEGENEQSFDYDDHRNRIYVRDKNGNKTHYGYDSRGNVTSKIDAFTNVTTIEYNSLNNPIRRVDALTNATTFGYDSIGNLTSTTNALNHVSQIQYIEGGLPFIITDARVIGTTNEFDPQGNLVAVIDAKGFTNRFGYDEVGRRILQIDALNRTNLFVQDNNDNLLYTVNALGFTNSFTYDGNNNRTSSRDPRGVVTISIFDLKNRLLAALGPLNYSISNRYDALDRKAGTRDARGNPTYFALDDVGNLIAVTNALNEVTRFTHDPNGNQSSAIDPTGHYITNFFDALNRKTATIDISVFTNLTSYDALGRVTATKNANGQTTQFFHDAIGRLTNVLDSADKSVFFDLDENGNRVRTTDPNGHTWTNVFDELNRLVEQSDPQGHKTVFQYDAVGNLTNKLTPNGDSISYSHDALNRLTKITYPTGPPVTLAYDSVGNRTNMTDSLGTTTWVYDDLNRLVSVTDPHGQSVTNEFDTAGNRVALTYPGNLTVRYGYDPLNRMVAFTNWLGGVVSYGYDNRGNLIATTNANNATAAYGYDVGSRLVTLTNVGANASVIAGYALMLDGIGNHLESSQAQPLYPLLPNQTNHYSYDSDNRLILVDGKTVTHDDNGNLTGLGSETFGYDFENSLIQFALTNFTGACVYDGVGNRLAAATNGVIRRYVLDRLGALTQVLAETDTNGVVLARYVFGLGLAQRITPDGTVSTYHFDVRGSTVALTDSTGHVTDGYAYDSFGVLANQDGDSPQPFRYLGRHGIMDDSSGLYYARARHFSPQLGRFLTKDPLSGNDGDGQSLNRYVYALNNPLRFVDITGLFGQDSVSLRTANSTMPFGTDSDGASLVHALLAGCGFEQTAIGAACGLADGLIYVFEGNWADAGLSVFSVIPVAGGVADVSKATRVGLRVSKSGIGATGKIGEDALRALGGESQVYFRTSHGGRYVDQFVSGIANESKVGYQSLTPTIGRQIAKDAELINSGQIQEATWNFFQSPVTGLGGPSQPLFNALQQNGINIIIHP